MLTYEWISACAPALTAYFDELKRYIEDAQHQPSLILATDSLCLKFEGMVRDLAALSGVQTFASTSDDQGRTVVREKDVHALLHEQPLMDLLGPDDTLFLRYLLIEKCGIGLRHKIAHCLQFPQEYALGHLHLLFVALMRLSKFQFASATSSPTDETSNGSGENLE